MILAMVGMLGGNFLSSAMYSNAFGIANFIVIISFFAILLIGFIIGGWAVKSQPFCTEWQPSRQLTRHAIPHAWIRIIVQLLLLFVLGWMGYFAVLTLAGTALGIGGQGAAGANNGLIGVAAAMFGGFWNIHYTSYYHLFTQDPASISSAADSNNYGNCGCNYCGDFVSPHDGNSTHSIGC